MWVDARSRAAYQYFGDVVCFDSTYLTNKYDLPFSNFVGVNHHGQTILLGCALLSHENAETFVWLFRAWLSCMGGKAPAAIMTYQDAAMRKEIRIVMPMPHTRHRWCMWHIMQKFSRKLGSLTDYPQIKVALKNVIYNSLSPEEFEEGWAEAIKKYKLEVCVDDTNKDTNKDTKQSSKWLQVLYKQRDMWIPAYVKHIFWARMQTTQRVESINSFFDGYLKKNTRLYQFAPRYCKAMESRANDERAADVNCSRFTRPLVGEFVYERKCQKVYTDAKFVEVQVQCTRVCYVTPVSKKDISDVEVEHTVSDRVWIWSKFLKKEISLGGSKRTYVVLFNKETLFGKCDCKYFECHGIVCRHIIKVLDMENVVTIPASYIMDRWRKDIQRKHTLVKVAYHDPEKTKEINRYEKIMNAVEPAALLGSQNEQKLDIMLEMVRAAMLRMDVSDVVTTEVADNEGGAASVLNRRGSDGPPTLGSVNKPPNSSGEESPCQSPPILAKDPVPRGGVKAHRSREKRFIPPGENTKPAKKQVRKNKKGVAEDAPPEQPATNPPVPFKQPMDPVAMNPDYTRHQGIKYGNAQNNFHPGWPNQFVMAGYNTVNIVDPQHQVGGNNVRACVGQMSGTLIYPQHNYNNGAPMQNYQASATRVGGGV
ncbi:protein FAR1-RELATED SEQUENCE 5-like [Spinacia oleracea]|uniref:Protein FAR1-RELATED SEQUENCE 5-like n=1 Tax=Spinacia oleracea TaxID=3562 RepID=A0ABM3R376_SPIOL|nr:protein FAR1-RELATED SEQUENCE 5-like [Spinacia oleracea]